VIASLKPIFETNIVKSYDMKIFNNELNHKVSVLYI